MDDLDIGAAIASIREERGIRQNWVAQKLGIAQPTLSLIESGRSPVRVHHLLKLSELWDLPLSAFVERAKQIQKLREAIGKESA